MPRVVDHEARRRQIAEALLRLASAHGLTATTMRDVAAEAGVSLRLVQYYFSTRDGLYVGSLPYLAERLTARVTASIRTHTTTRPPLPRDIVEATLRAILPTDDESRWIRRTYDAFYAVALDQPDLAARHGAPDTDALERFIAAAIHDARYTAGAGERDSRLCAAGLIALTNGLGASVLGGQRTPEAALEVLDYHLDQTFGAAESTASTPTLPSESRTGSAGRDLSTS